MRGYEEVSCGAVVYTQRRGQILFLLIQSLRGVWGFPKGHMEKNETERETAVREIREETGLQVELQEHFREEDAYPLTRYGNAGATKRVVYFLATYMDQAYKRQETEVAQIRLVPFETAMNMLSFPSARKILAAACAHIPEMNPIAEQPELL